MIDDRRCPSMPSVSVRYIVDDVDDAIRFYVGHLGFNEVMHPAPTFAMLARGELRLALTKAGGGPGGGSALPDGTLPTPGGWNRFAIETEDVERLYTALLAAGVQARSPIMDGVGGRQVIIDDPSGNPVELFQPTIAEARLGG
jgi:catechol 2,3-dioxygenase-like lactoylglutathione lyase family enzyme